MNYRPPVGYYFTVEFTQGFGKIPGVNHDILDIDASFKEVSGLTAELPVEKFQEGGVNDFQHPLPKPATFTNISLKRGLAINSNLATWMSNALENFQVLPKDLTIKLLGQDGKPIAAWEIIGAYPVKWDISGFNAMDNAIVIESLDLTCRKHRRLLLSGVEDVKVEVPKTV